MRPIRHTPHNLDITSFGLGERVRSSLFDIVIGSTIHATVPALLVCVAHCVPALEVGVPCELVSVMVMMTMAMKFGRWKKRRTSNGLVRSRLYIVWEGEPGDVSVEERKDEDWVCIVKGRITVGHGTNGKKKKRIKGGLI